jgi:hypothetical protein
MRRATKAVTIGLALVIGGVLAACGSTGAPSDGSGSPGTSGASTPAPRPSSTAKLSIVAPANGQTVAGPKVNLKLALAGAKIVQATSTNLKPDEGHLHVYLDGRIVSMTFGLDQEIPDAAPGQHVIRVEFVASDHAPFAPRVFAQVVFTVGG